MLENRSPDSCLSSRVFSSSRVSYMYPEDDKLTNGKRALEAVGGEIRPTKSLKLMGFCITYDSDSSDCSLSGDGSQEQSDSNNNGGD
ncbi:hypothetical protein F2Q68_00020378 [Brassica cretica]|uniref:Uncharacterized protein n=1 Tax=Brassica cretica TaxID=69181 RepID=A0A8S9FZI2_BRACR|nr:hypothetical protein F2Q68_00020378 [Brassica cretica]